MSISIQIPTVLRRFTDSRAQVDLDASNVREALSALVTNYPHLQKHLYDEAGALRSFVNVYVGDQDVRQLPEKHETKLSSGAELTIIPSIAGGAC